jgi:hypothetical protein
MIKSLEKYGTKDMLPARKEVAESDPATDTINHSFWIRQWADKAIDAIQRSAGQH